MVGTLAYMAPEQAAGKRVDERARPLQPGARALRGAGGRQPGPRRLAGRDRAPRRHRAAAAAAQPQGPAGRAVRRDRPRAAPEPGRARDARGARRRARRGAAGGLRRRRDRRAAPARAHGAARAAARARRAARPPCAGGLAAAALAGPAQPLLPALAAVAAVVACFPRRRLARRGGRGRRAARRRARRAPPLLVAAALMPVPLLLRRRGRLVAAGARAAARPRGPRRRVPALAGRARGPLTAPPSARSAPGGCCWPRRSRRTLLLGPARARPSATPRERSTSARAAAHSVSLLSRRALGAGGAACCPGWSAAAGWRSTWSPPRPGRPPSAAATAALGTSIDVPSRAVWSPVQRLLAFAVAVPTAAILVVAPTSGRRL